MKHIALALLAFTIPVEAKKVLLITSAYNKPQYIELQHKTFKKFLQDDYEFVVFNDARDHAMAQQIFNKCKELEIRCMRVPQDIHTQPYLPRQPGENVQSNNIRHANVVQYAMDTVGFYHDGAVCLLDSDCFIIRPFSISEYMADKDIATYIKSVPTTDPVGFTNNTSDEDIDRVIDNLDERINYINPILCMFSMDRLPDKKALNFNYAIIQGRSTDSCGGTGNYFSQHPELQIKGWDAIYSHQLYLGDRHVYERYDAVPFLFDFVITTLYLNLGFTKKEMKFLLKRPDTFEFYLGKHFIHYRDGSNDNGMPQSYHDKKLKIFTEFIEDICANGNPQHSYVGQ